MALIAEGALDGEAVDALAERLGVGERQLRRLFRQHLGASPIAVAQTRRVLFAKQLIVETTMPMTEVALASGFSSIRRFNATFHTLYRRPPRELRRSSSAVGEQTGAEGITLMLAYAPPYDWDAMIGFLAARAITGIEAVDASKRYRRSIALDGAQGAIRVEPDERERGLRVTIRFPRIASLATIVRRVRRIFDLSADPLAIGEDLARDPLLAPLVARRPGLRVPGAWDGFEVAVRAMLGQQITVTGALKLAAKLVAAYGEKLCPSDGTSLTHTFPTPEIPVIMPKPDLTALTGGYRKTPVLQIGADIYCDSQLIMRELERRHPTPSFYPAGRGAADALAWWAEKTTFSPAVSMAFAKKPDALPEGFLEDRAKFSGRNIDPAAMMAAVPNLLDQLRAHFDWLDQSLADSRSFLQGSAASLADLAAYHPIWFLKQNFGLTAAPLDGFPRLLSWAERVAAIGHGRRSPMTSEQALDVARTATSIAKASTDAKDPIGRKPGQVVSVTPDDTGRDPVIGELVTSGIHEIVIRRSDPAIGEVCVHFPRAGFVVTSPSAISTGPTPALASSSHA